MLDLQTVQIAVALVKSNKDQVAISWNGNWGAFVLPMTKLDITPPAESAEQAAVRAAAEVFGLPCRVVPGQSGKAMRKLQLGQRDGELKDYHFTVVPVEVHPDFQSAITNRPVLMPAVEKLQTGDYQPMSPSVKPILDACVEWGWV
jgi:hypothetical protein